MMISLCDVWHHTSAQVNSIMCCCEENKCDDTTPTFDHSTYHTIVKLVVVGNFLHSYPALLQTQDGRIHVAFSYRKKAIKHVIVDEHWIEHGPPSTGVYQPHLQSNREPVSHSFESWESTSAKCNESASVIRSLDPRNCCACIWIPWACWCIWLGCGRSSYNAYKIFKVIQSSHEWKHIWVVTLSNIFNVATQEYCYRGYIDGELTYGQSKTLCNDSRCRQGYCRVTWRR